MKYMQSKIALERSLFKVSAVGIAFFSVVIFFLTLGLYAQGSDVKLVSSSSTQTLQNLVNNRLVTPAILKPANPGLPIRLKIPKIKVNAAIEHKGLTAKGEMGVPKLPGNVAWFSLGTRPGEIGTAAMAGHVDWWNGATAVFANLKKLKIGDKIIVQDENGKDVSFIVRKIRTYSSKESAPDVFHSSDGKAHLTLITCYGAWDKNAKQYSKRLVVFADKV